MACFQANVIRMNEVAAQINQAAQRLNNIADNIQGLTGGGGISAASYWVIRNRIRSMAQSIENEEERAKVMASALTETAKLYTNCETALSEGELNWISNEGENSGGQAGDVENVVSEESHWYDALPSSFAKTVLDIIGTAGDGGKIAALPIAILKMLVDGDGFTAKDTGAIIKGAGNSIIGFLNANSKGILNKEGLKELFGLNECKTIVTDSSAGWWGNVSDSFKKTLKDKLMPVADDIDNGGTKIKGSTVAGWALTLIANGFSNYDEYQTGGISGGRAVAETVSESVIDVLKMAGLTAAVAAGAAAIGLSAPAVVVGGVAVAVSAVADYVSKQFTGKAVTELVSDGILDLAENVGNWAGETAQSVKKKVTGAISSIGDAVSGWASKWIPAW